MKTIEERTEILKYLLKCLIIHLTDNEYISIDTDSGLEVSDIEMGYNADDKVPHGYVTFKSGKRAMELKFYESGLKLVVHISDITQTVVSLHLLEHLLVKDIARLAKGIYNQQLGGTQVITARPESTTLSHQGMHALIDYMFRTGTKPSTTSIIRALEFYAAISREMTYGDIKAVPYAKFITLDNSPVYVYKFILVNKYADDGSEISGVFEFTVAPDGQSSIRDIHVTGNISTRNLIELIG